MSFLNTVAQGLSAAHAGEMLLSNPAAAQVLRAPGSAPVPAAPASPAQSTVARPVRRKLIALWLTEVPDQAVVRYALSTSERMGMDLILVHPAKVHTQDIVTGMGDLLENAPVSISIHALDTTDEDALFDYVEATPRIAMLVMGNPHSRVRSWDHRSAFSPVPVVIVASAESDAGSAETSQVLAA